MEDNIYLFENYLEGNLPKEEKERFDSRLRSDKEFATDFKVFLLTVRGICQEAQQDNLEFAKAMENVSEKDFLKIIGRDGETGRKRKWNNNLFRRQFAWIASVAAILIVGIFTIIHVEQAARHELDNAIVAYNPVAEIGRNGEELSAIADMSNEQLREYLPELEKDYRDAPPDDIQAAEMAGMRLAMSYLRLHDRKRAKALLGEMKVRFADDPAFAERCDMIINQLK